MPKIVYFHGPVADIFVDPVTFEEVNHPIGVRITGQRQLLKIDDVSTDTDQVYIVQTYRRGTPHQVILYPGNHSAKVRKGLGAK
jgi:hypothetical protein